MSELWQVIEGDSLAVLPTLADGSVDAVVTDPPYGIGFDYNGEREETSDPDSYWQWLCPRYKEALRCLKPGGLMAVWQTQLNFRHFWDWFGPDIHIYAACKNFVQLRATPINYGYDPVVMFYKRGAKPLCPVLSANGAWRNIDFYVADTSAVVAKPLLRVKHPCPRPLDQMVEIVRNFTLPGGTVLDPFAGSGTTGMACLRTGKKFVGVEISARYCDVARKRLAEAEGAYPLFVGTPEPELFAGVNGGASA